MAVITIGILYMLYLNRLTSRSMMNE